eukprot:473886-Pleurochrysis_carterae.AAC.1
MRRFGLVGTVFGVGGRPASGSRGVGRCRYPRRLVASCVAGCRRDCRARSDSGVFPGISVLVKVHVRREYHTRHAGHEDVVGSGRGEAASK